MTDFAAISAIALVLAAPTVSADRSDADPACARLAIAMPAGSELSQKDIVPTPCTHERIAALGYEQHSGRVRARTDLSVGAYLGRVQLRERQAINRGQPVRLHVALDGISISRTVVALEDLPSDGYAFVQTPEGEALSVPVNGAHIRLEQIQ